MGTGPRNAHFAAWEALALLSTLASGASAQPATMVRDIATVARELPPVLLAASHPPTELDGSYYFVASDGVHGRELWRTDGTALGTWMVEDICPGKCSSGFGLGIVPHAGRLYFSADDGVHGRELWRSDGTAAGTVRVTDLRPGPDSSSPESITSALGRLFFTADSAEHGRELWASDGTAAGTALIADINPTGSSTPLGLIEVGGRLLFSAFHPLQGRQVWRTSGEPGETDRILAASGGVSSQAEQTPSKLLYSARLGDRLVFSGHDPVHGQEAWVTDGTDAGTELIVDLNPGPADGAMAFFTALGDHVFFVAVEPGSLGDRELWKTDGTEAGTSRVADIFPGPGGSYPGALNAVGDQLYFTAVSSDAVGRELWITDGTEAGTRMVRDIGPGAASGLAWSMVYGLNGVGDRLFFRADDGTSGLEPWVTDGTEEGTTRLADINTGLGWSFDPFSLPFVASDVAGRAFFFAFDPIRGWEPWTSDGTSAGTGLLANLDDQVSSVPATLRMRRTDLAATSDRVFFAAEEAVHGVELWASDGTEAGTALVRDIAEEPGSYLDTEFAGHSRPQELVSLGGRLGFAASDDRGVELWASDGTAGQTVLIDDLHPGADSAYPRDLHRFGDQILFFAEDGSSSRLYGTRGSAGDTVALSTEGGSTPATAAGAVFFLASYGALARTAGEPGTTTEVVPDGVSELAGAGHRLYFARDGDLWRTDGTPGETVPLSSFSPAPGIPEIADFEAGRRLAGVTATGEVLFFADDGVHGLEPWWSDGTPEGTRLLADVRPGPESAWPRRPIGAGRKVFFWADDGESGVELWISDGTTGGTGRVTDLEPGPGSSHTSTWESAAAAVFGELFFAANRGGVGVELWRSDGTAEGTTLFQDVNAGGGSSSPDNMLYHADRLYFTANDGIHGYELWSAPMSAPRIRALLSVSGGFFPRGLVHYSLVIENLGDFAIADGPAAEMTLPVPDGVTVVAVTSDGGTTDLASSEAAVLWHGGLPPRGTVTIEVTARLGLVPPGTEIATRASVLFDTTGDGLAEPPVFSDDPSNGPGDTRFVVENGPLAIPGLSLPGILALASLLAAAATRRIRRGQGAPRDSTPSSTSR